MNRRRPKQIVIRGSEEEFNKIKLKVSKSKLTQNEYLLKCCLNKKIIVLEGIEEVTLELKSIGQKITKLYKEETLNKGEIKELQMEMKEAWQLLRQLIQKTQ